MFVLYHTQDISVRMVQYLMTSIRAPLVQCLTEQISPQLMNVIHVLSVTTAGNLSLLHCFTCPVYLCTRTVCYL